MEDEEKNIYCAWSLEIEIFLSPFPEKLIKLYYISSIFTEPHKTPQAVF